MNIQMLGEQIRKARRAKDITQAELAKMVERTEPAVSMWERSVTTPPLSIYFKLVEILDLPSSQEQ